MYDMSEDIYENNSKYNECFECDNVADWITGSHPSYYFCNDHHPLRHCPLPGCKKCEESAEFIMHGYIFELERCSKHDHPE